MSDPEREALREAATRLSDAITDRAAAGRGDLDTTYDVDAAYLAAVKALRAALSPGPEPVADTDGDDWGPDDVCSQCGKPWAGPDPVAGEGGSIYGWGGPESCPRCGTRNPHSWADCIVLYRARPEPVAGLDPMNLRTALLHIRDNYGQVCAEFELCTHVSCRSSMSAWTIANAALSPGPEPVAGLDVRTVLRAVLDAGHGPMLGSGATFRRCRCVVHEEAFALSEASS